MIFNFPISIVTLYFIIFPLSTVVDNTSYWNSENVACEEEIEIEPHHVAIDDSAYYLKKHTQTPEVNELELDLDGNGLNEKITAKTYPGFPGDQNTEIYINSKPQPVFTEAGTFYALNVHKIDNNNNYVTELQLQTGQSLNVLFYSYKNGKLKRVSVSTEKSPSWHGIISRNIPEFKDIDKDGSLELLAYRGFLYDPTRTIEVYKYDGTVFNLIRETLFNKQIFE